MIKIKPIMLVLAIIAIACFLTACNGKDEPTVESDEATEQTTTVPAGDDANQDLVIARDAMAKLGKGLKARLQDAMQSGGVINAIEVCKLEAVPITEAISIQEGVIVSRTSLRIRNPRNVPDDWERETLEAFKTRRAGGEEATNLEAWTITTDDGGQRTFRYMKAIPTATLCLHCHGEDIASNVAAKLAALYPEDTAVGFAPGEIRGAFTVTKPLLD